jgi:hypothetical protein
VTLAALDLPFYYSATAPSIGGVITDLPIPQEYGNLFDDTSKDDLKFGTVVYKKVFLKNDGLETLDAAKLWLLMQPTDGGDIAIGLGDASDTDPTVVVFSSPGAAADGLDFGPLAPGESQGIWLRLTILTNSNPFDGRNYFQLAITGPLTKLFAIIWQMKDESQEDEDMGTLAYEMKLQLTDDSGQIVSEEDLGVSFQLPNSIAGDNNILLQPNQIDVEVPMADPLVDFVYIKGDKSNEITAKFGSVTGTPFTVQAGGGFMMASKNIAGIFLTNPNGANAVVRVFQAKRQPVLGS